MICDIIRHALVSFRARICDIIRHVLVSFMGTHL